MKNFYFILLSLFLLSCAGTTSQIADTEDLPLNLSITPFSSLPGWERENFEDFGQAFSRSCDALLKSRKDFLKNNPRWGSLEKWKTLCTEFSSLQIASYRRFFEANFNPYQLLAGQEEEGLFTGYYEASLKGSAVQKGSYQTPLRGRPDDLVMVQLGDFRDELKGQRIAGRVIDGRLKVYETRAEIEKGDLSEGQDRPLVWVDNPIDAFFVQVQGSGVVEMDDGTVKRIGYAGQNGHVYTAIGRELIARGALTKDNVSLQTIRDWLEQNPDEAENVMNVNESYVFFREIEGEGPIGGQGVALTPARSLAIDHSLLPYGAPLWLEVDHPLQENKKIRRLMVAQDTGGAIRGPVRGDFFWGYGDYAVEHAGPMKSKGRYWILLPR